MEQRPRRQEGFEVLLRRYFREVQTSGILTEAKDKRFFKKDESRSKRREAAIRKAVRKTARRGY